MRSLEPQGNPPPQIFQTGQNYTVGTKIIALGAKLLHYITLLFRINFPKYVVHFFRIGFELFPRLCNLLRCYEAYHVGIGLLHNCHENRKIRNHP